MHALAGGMQGVAAATGIVESERASRFQRVDDDPVVGERQRGDPGGAVEGGSGCRRVPGLPVEAARGGIVEIHLRGKRPIVDLDLLGGVAGGIDRCRNHHRDAVSRVAHGLGGEQPPLGGVERGAVARLDLRPAGQRADPRRDEVAPGEHRGDSVASRRLVDDHAAESGVRMGGAHDVCLQGIRSVEIAGVASLPAQMAGVFAPHHTPSATQLRSSPA